MSKSTWRLVRYFGAIYFLIALIGQLAKIHDHLHALECATFGYMTDGHDGARRWDSGSCPDSLLRRSGRDHY